MDALKIKIQVEADGAGVGPGMSAATASVVGFERAATKSLDRVKGAFTGLSTSTKVLGGLGLGLGALALGIGQVIGPAIEFESAFAGVLKTVDGSTGQLNAIRTGLLELSTVMPTSAADLASIAENAGQLGVAAGDVLEFTEVVAKLGETTDLDFDQAAQSLARFLNVTGNQASISQLGDVIVELGNNSATTESQIVTFATRLASSFSLAGASEDQILAIGAAFSSLGVEAEAGSSALSRVITQIADAAKLGGKDLEVFAQTAGLLPAEFAKIAKENPVEALVLFGEGLAKVTEEGRSITPVLEQLDLAGIRTSRVMQLLALDTDGIRTALALASNQFENGGAAQEEYARRAETTASRIDLLQNRLQALSIAAGTPLLAGFAQGADLAGDAIERLVSELAPLGAEGAGLFRALADSASVFFEVLGGPSLGLAVSALQGLVAVSAGVLSALTALGPGGLVLAALVFEIGRMGPLASLAVRGIDKLSAVLFLLKTGGTQAAFGMSAAATAMRAMTIVAGGLGVAAIIGVGNALNGAREAAIEAGQAFRDDFSAALQAGDYEGIQSQIGGIKSKIEELREFDKVPDGVATSWEGWGASISSAAQALVGVESGEVKARLEANELEKALNDLGLQNLGTNLGFLASQFGVSESAIISAAEELGVLPDLTNSASSAFQQASNELAFFFAASLDAAGGNQELADKMQAGTAEFKDYSEALGVTVSDLGFLAEQIEGVSVDDLLDKDKAGEALDAIESLVNVYSVLADQIGISTEEFLRQVTSVDALAGAHSNLRSTIDGTLAAYEQIDAQQRITTESTVAFSSALESIDGTEESLNTAASAMRTLSADSAGLADSAEAAALNQLKLAAELRLVALEAGFSEESIIRALSSYGLLNEASLAKIVLEGQSLRNANDEITASLDQLAKEYVATLLADDLASDPILVAFEAARLFGDSYTATLGAADAGSLGLIGTTTGEAEELADGEYTAALGADADPALVKIAEVRDAIGDLTQGEYVAFLLANGVQAEDAIAFTEGRANDYAGGQYESILTSDGSGAQSEIQLTEGQANAYAQADYGSILTSNGSSAKAEISDTKSKADGYAKSYGSTLHAIDNASSTIFGAISALRGFQSKTIYLRTVTVARTGSTYGGYNSYNADGGIMFADGGTITDRGVEPGAVVSQYLADAGATKEIPGPAKIYKPTTVARYFAEPVTGGESYIPLSQAKRGSAIPVWMETGRLLGVLENGGIQGATIDSLPRTVDNGGTVNSFVLHAPIQIDISGGSAVDPREIQEMVTRQIASSFDNLATRVSQMRT